MRGFASRLCIHSWRLLVIVIGIGFVLTWALLLRTEAESGEIYRLGSPAGKGNSVQHSLSAAVSAPVFRCVREVITNVFRCVRVVFRHCTHCTYILLWGLRL